MTPPPYRAMRSTCSGVKVATPEEAKLLVHATVLGLLPRIEWRLSAEERRDIRPGDVFVWADHAANADSGGASLERWTDGRHWGPSRMRDEFLFYYERESESDDLGYAREPGTARMIKYAHRPNALAGPRAPALPLNANGALDPSRLIKQAYSLVLVSGPGAPTKWHMTTYFTKASLELLANVRDVRALRELVVPPGRYVFFKAWKAQMTAQQQDSSRRLPPPSLPPPSASSSRQYSQQQDDRERERYERQRTSPPLAVSLPALSSVLPPAHVHAPARSPPPAPTPSKPGLPSPTDLGATWYPRRAPEDQRAIQSFHSSSPPRC